MITNKTTVLTVPASNAALGNVTSPFALGIANKVGVIVPALTSCQAFLQVASDQASASFVRAVVQSGQLSYAVAAGPAAIDVSDPARAFAFGRIELSAPQASVRSLSIIQRA